MEKSLLTEVKAILKSLVLSCPDKITVEQLNRDYRDVEGRLIPFRQLGYGNLEEFLRSVPDTLRIFGSGPSAMVCFVANEKSDHIHDMIMRQKKPKSKGRSSGSKSSGLNRNNAFQGKGSRPTAKTRGQQLSPYQSINRSQMSKTLQVKPLAMVTPRTNIAAVHQPMQAPNTGSAMLSNHMLYNLPQPYGILPTPVLSTIQCVNAQLYQNTINQIASIFKSQCSVAQPPPPPLARHQNKNISVPSQKKSPIQVEAIAAKKESQKEINNIVKTPEKATAINTSPVQFKPPPAKKQLSIKFSENVEDILAMPKLRKPVEEPRQDFSVKETRKVEKEDNIKWQPRQFFEDSTENVEDPDEAIPSFAAKNNVFRMDFPDHTVAYGNKIPSCELPDNATVGNNLKIFVTEIHSPFKFWFHFHKEDHELDLLMYKIELYYTNLDSDDLRIPPDCLTPGQVCAAVYNGLWHRAEIVAPPVNKSVKVFFVDYGTVTEVEIVNVKFLLTCFSELPAQAYRGCLSHIKPRLYHWSHEATAHFLTLVNELLVYGKITEIDEQKNILYMILVDTNGDKPVQINKSLVDNQYAAYYDDWKTERIKQNNGKRLHHPREDFPTFSMIENGEYPSFLELVRLQQRGIDYEAIYDINLFNQSTILNKHESASEALKSLPFLLTSSNPFRTDILSELYATTIKAI